jgi:cytoskeletal protein CcmA (bactofilin family)
MFRKIWKLLLVVQIAVIFLLLPATQAAAADIRGYEDVIIASGDVVDDDLYLAGNRIVINGTVNGDVIAAGSTIIIDGTVNGDVIALASTVTIDGEITGSARVAGSDVSIGGTIGEDLITAGSSIIIKEASGIGRDLIFGAGNIEMDSRISGDIKGIAEIVEITNIISGDADIEVKELTITSTANIKGNLTYVSSNEATIHSGAVIGGEISRHLPAHDKWDRSWNFLPLINPWLKVLSFLAALLVGIIIILVIPEKSVQAAMAIRNKPLASLGWGALILFLAPLAILISILTIIGIPVGLLAIILYVILIFVSQLVVGLFIGQWIVSKLNIKESRGSLIGALAIGLLLLTLLRLIPVVGWVVWLATTLFGIGAVGVLVFRKRKKVVVVPVEVIESPQS